MDSRRRLVVGIEDLTIVFVVGRWDLGYRKEREMSGSATAAHAIDSIKFRAWKMKDEARS